MKRVESGEVSRTSGAAAPRGSADRSCGRRVLRGGLSWPGAAPVPSAMA